MSTALFLKKRCCFGLAALFFSVLIAGTSWGAVRGSAPALKLFPQDVKENLNQTGQTAKAMESDLKEVIMALETQVKLSQAANCEDAQSDPGCQEITKQISEHYHEMLQIMKNSLPEMKASIQKTNKGIEKRLRQQLGRKSTPAEIQKMLGKQAMPKVTKGRFSLSGRFAKYYSMISTSSKGSSLAKLAAEIYLDSSEVTQWIDLMEADISRQELYLDVGSSYGPLTSEMLETVGSVKNIIFGEEEDMSGIPDAPAGAAGGFDDSNLIPQF